MSKLYPAIIFCFAGFALHGCATQTEVREVKVPVPVTVSCPQVEKPVLVEPKDDSRVEWLRAKLINDERIALYVKELEGALEACR